MSRFFRGDDKKPSYVVEEPRPQIEPKLTWTTRIVGSWEETLQRRTFFHLPKS